MFACGGKDGPATGPTLPNHPAVSSVTVTSASSAPLLVGAAVQLTATLKDASGNVLGGRAVTWASNDQAKATVSTLGVVTAVAPGSANISASSEGQTGSLTVTIFPIPVGAVKVEPASSSLEVGMTRQFTAIATSTTGTTLTGRSVSWSAGDSSILSVSGVGVVSAIRAGSTTVAATVDGITGSASVTVFMATPPAIITQPQDVTVARDSAARLQVVATGETPISFQWLRNGTAIPGATSSTYTIASVERADSLATFAVRASNRAGSVTSREARVVVLGKTVFGLGGFRAILTAADSDLVGARFRFVVTENSSPGIKILFMAHGMVGALNYFIETNVYSQTVRGYASGACTNAYPGPGIRSEGVASFRPSIADYHLQLGNTSARTTGLRTLDPINYPQQTYIIDNIANLWKSDAISQANLNGVEVLVTIERGDTTSNTGPYASCAPAYQGTLYRKWLATVQGNAITSVVEFIVPEQNGRYLSRNQFFNLYTEFMHTNGVFTTQFWDHALKRNSDPAWRPVTTFLTHPYYDGNGTDFGVRIVNIGGQRRFEVSNKPGEPFMLRNVSF